MNLRILAGEYRNAILPSESFRTCSALTMIDSRIFWWVCVKRHFLRVIRPHWFSKGLSIPEKCLENPLTGKNSPPRHWWTVVVAVGCLTPVCEREKEGNSRWLARRPDRRGRKERRFHQSASQNRRSLDSALDSDNIPRGRNGNHDPDL